MKNIIRLLTISLLALTTASAGELPDCWFRLVTEKPLKKLTLKDIKILPPPAFTSITVAYWKDTGLWTVKLRSSEPIPGDVSAYASIGGHVAHPPLIRQKPGEPSVVAFGLPTQDLARSYAAGLARLHKIPADAIKTEKKHAWP